MADTNTWAIIVPAIVTPTVVAGYAYFQGTQARRATELDELRVVLDAGAAAASDASMYLLPPMNMALGRLDTLEWENWEAAAKGLRDARHARDRIRLRLGGQNRVTIAYVDFVDSLSSYYNLLTDGADDPDQFDKAVHNTLRQATWDKLEQFLDVASAEVGIRLPGPPSPLYPALPLPPGETR